MVWNIVALEPDSDRWLTLRAVLGRLGHRAVAVDSVRGIESVLDAFEVEGVLIRPVGNLEEHRRLAQHLSTLGTRVYVTAEISQPQILALYYALGDQTRTVRMHPAELANDMPRHARETVDRLPPLPEFGIATTAANDAPLVRIDSATERAPSRPRRKETIHPDRLRDIRSAVAHVG